MASPQLAKQPQTASEDKTKAARLFFLDASSGRVPSVNPDGSDKKAIASGGRVPDGIAVDTYAAHIYWTNMGVPNHDDGSIERVDLDGKNRTTIGPEGETFTPKQLTLDRKNGKRTGLALGAGHRLSHPGSRVLTNKYWF